MAGRIASAPSWRRFAGRLAVLAALFSVALSAPSVAAQDIDPSMATVADYYAVLEKDGLIDVGSGNRDSLRRELTAAEKLLQAGASIDAAVALYAIVESPRYEGFDDFIEFQNAEYYLGVALASTGAYESALTYFLRAVARGSDAMYFAPAHRWVIDVALDSRDYRRVLDLLEGVEISGELPPEARSERAYLRARVAYAQRDFAAAEKQLKKLSRKSRLYSSSLYLRGVIRTRQGEYRRAAEALCEIVDTPDDDDFSLVIDERYYSIKDLARLGLGRIAHEQGEYDDAYYHYFQIPDDSDALPNALFEAAWSMYQKRDLDASRDLVTEFLENFPTSPLMPEARLLAGYVELADCEFIDAQVYYDKLVVELQPIVDELDRIRKDPERRAMLFTRAVERWNAERADPTAPVSVKNPDVTDKVVGLLRLDPKFLRLNKAVHGIRRTAGEGPHLVRAWGTLARWAKETSVSRVARETTVEEEDAADANGLLEDVRRLREQIKKSQADLARGRREKLLPRDAADAESKRLRQLDREARALEGKARDAARAADAALEAGTSDGLRPMIAADLARARQNAEASAALRDELLEVAAILAKQSADRLYQDARRVLDKAKLGKIDAIIGQKRRLDIEVQDLASGRFPAELTGRLWEEGMIGDDEEYWPFEGEYWSDEYEGWR